MKNGVLMANSLVSLALIIGIALALGATPVHAQTLAEFGGVSDAVGTLTSQSALANYQSAPDYLPTIDSNKSAAYQTEALDTNNDVIDSTTSATNFTDNTNFAATDYSTSGFSTSTDYKSANDYSNPTDMP